MMAFEFDPAKSAANKAKHGIDFVEAQAIWQDADRLEIAARSTTEARSQVIGRVQQTTWSAFVTYRHEDIRIISVRRARKEEEAQYLEDRSEVRTG
ncbi:MAG: BrnT family toxin [Vicinamibacterales bacterium]